MTSSRIPSDLREVTASWLTEALHSKEVSSKASVTGYSAETIAGGNGFMNQVVRLGLRYDDDPVDLPRSVVLKLPSADPALRMLSNRLGSSQRVTARRSPRWFHKPRGCGQRRSVEGRRPARAAKPSVSTGAATSPHHPAQLHHTA